MEEFGCNTVNIQEAAGASGLPADTIRFYERKGVLPRPPRQGNRYRNYTEDHVCILRLAKGLRQLGVPLDHVAPILAVAHDGTCGDVREKMTATLEDALESIGRQLAELTQSRDHLTTILGGLRAMNSEDTNVPGMQPCRCVALVSSEQSNSKYVTRS